MVEYRRVTTQNKEDGETSLRYLKNSKFTKIETVPPEVLEKLEYAERIEYDDEPTKRRCLACDGPQKRQRYLNSKTVDLCEWHYQHLTLGKIAERVRVVAQQNEARLAKEVADKEAKKTHHKKGRRTALSAAIAA